MPPRPCICCVGKLSVGQVIQERLDTTGYFGLGKEEDAKYAEENF